jgi:hypothetical protein
VTIVSYPEIPLGITGIYCRKKADKMPGNFHGMLVAESVDGLKSCSLNGVNETIAHYIDFDGLPVRTKRMLSNGHLNSTLRNTFLPILHTIILWGLGVEE